LTKLDISRAHYHEPGTPKPGGGVRHVDPPGFAHTSAVLASAAELRTSHPEWFADTSTDPRRPAHGHQLCWGNRSMLSFIAERAIEYLRADETADVVSVSQNDGTGTDLRAPELGMDSLGSMGVAAGAR
jgi:hypothetical protein